MQAQQLRIIFNYSNSKIKMYDTTQHLEKYEGKTLSCTARKSIN